MDPFPLIRDLAPVERPRERLARHGAEVLDNVELFALVARTGYKGADALHVAKQWLDRYSLHQLAELSLTQLMALPGMGLSRASAWLASLELARRVNRHWENGRPVLRTVSDIAFHAIEIREKKKEYLLAFILNARHELIAKETISVGTLTASLAHPREIFAPAIGRAAAGIILVHNHPSGNPTPSEEDRRLTRRIMQAGQIMGIELLDHVIVAESGCYSFKSSGEMLREEGLGGR